MKIIRVFPRRTRATPNDELAYVGLPTMFSEADKVHISVAFTYDLKEAEYLAKQWKHIAPVEIGGPATGESGGEFTPGMYLKYGYVITSRGCPNKCWFCSVWRREGSDIRELRIKAGWNVLDDNILVCSDDHIMQVFSMLKQQSKRAEFTGGLEAKRLKQWHVDELVKVNPKQMFFAYDTPDDYEPLYEAGKMLKSSGFTMDKRVLRAYVLIGYPKDTIEKAEIRLRQAFDAGFLPMAMLWKDDKGTADKQWSRFQRLWARPQIIMKNIS